MAPRNPIAKALRAGALGVRVVPGRRPVPTHEIDQCRTCGVDYDGYGDGWDGECPDCADRTFEREEGR